MPYFTVVIPLFNKQNYVAESIRSVLAQTFYDFELLIIDDKSTDQSLIEAERIDDARIRIIKHKSNKGLSATRNTGWHEASAQFIAFLDADDLWRNDFLETIALLIEKFPSAGIFATSYDEFYSNGRHIAIKANLTRREDMFIVDDFFEASRFQPIYWFGSAVIARNVFDAVGGFDPNINFGEDTDFNIRANLKFDLAYCAKSCALYRMDSENQITRESFTSKKITDFNRYEHEASGNPSLKKFLDANRYFLAMKYKSDGNNEQFNKLVREIDKRNLNSRQKLLLKMPLYAVKFVRAIKRMLLLSGKRVTSFGG